MRMKQNSEPAAVPTIEVSSEDCPGLSTFVEISENSRGSITPAETFIWNLVVQYHHHGLTPDDAAKELEEFRETFEESIELAKRTIDRYPAFFQAPKTPEAA
jgi:hypothetical protein